MQRHRYVVIYKGVGDWERRSRRGLESFQGHCLAVNRPHTGGVHEISANYGGHDWDVTISRTVTGAHEGEVYSAKASSCL